VGTEIGDAAAGVLAVAPPIRVTPVDALGAEDFVVAALRGRAEPEVPIGPFGNRLFGQVARDRRVADADADGVQLADAAVADQLDGRAKVVGILAALLA